MAAATGHSFAMVGFTRCPGWVVAAVVEDASRGGQCEHVALPPTAELTGTRPPVQIFPQGNVRIATAAAIGVAIALLLVGLVLVCGCSYMRRERERYAQLELRFNELAQQVSAPAPKPGVLISPAEQAARLRERYFSGRAKSGGDEAEAVAELVAPTNEPPAQ